jgi:hypothetical protein
MARLIVDAVRGHRQDDRRPTTGHRSSPVPHDREERGA